MHSYSPESARARITAARRLAAAAQAAALAVHYCHHRIGPTREVTAWIDDRLGVGDGSRQWSRPWEGPVGKLAHASVHAALSTLASHGRMSDLLMACVAYTGDVDTVAAIAVAAGSRADDIEHDLPQHLYDTLENGPFGRDYLVTLDQQLLRRYS